MSSTGDEIKGRAKEAAGALSDDPDLKREGKLDQLGAKAKEMAEDAKDRVEDVIDDVKDALTKD